MFTIPSAVSTAVVVRPSFQIMNTTINGQVPMISSSNDSNNNIIQPDICINTSVLGRLATSTTNQREEENSSLGNDVNLDNNQQDLEIELFINNVVCSFELGCELNLHKIATKAANVTYKRGHTMILMKIRNPYCSANLWSSGKVTVAGTRSEDDAQRAARRVARCLQRLGFKTEVRNYRVVNCHATCSMPWSIDLIKLSRLYPECVSFEPEIHPGATVRLNNRAVLKVFTTGSVILTAPSVDIINMALNEFYPQLFECRK